LQFVTAIVTFYLDLNLKVIKPNVKGSLTEKTGRYRHEYQLVINGMIFIPKVTLL